ncbi:MAG TPA: efflux RND transporter periplasmic adaptor subunit [Candidatus Pelagibacter bacterium]|jgi:membrane fusion protein (multidrug efflux system)|nr:efflux transporter periplasmic adaptor subunit [Flavobacteriaceae bacterium]HJN83910.1 efflux RND transporter periplasmic adaptor subunit [Candidatus Pelagibacter bacterium]|tara:strand:+ start:518 stop:1387 length:870 start_codon:yes stop_codon:yes gene_type:complete
MKRSTKITSIIIIFFLVITTVVVARTMIGKHFQKKFGKRPPPGIIVTVVNQKKFQNKIETFGTAVPIRTKAYQIEKFEIISPIKFNQKVKKGDVIAKLKTRNIIAPFDGVIGKRDFSDDIAISASSIVVNIEDASILYVDVDIPEIYAPYINEGLSTDIKFSGNNEKIYKGIIESTASRINTEKRSLAARVRLNNSNLELLPGALLEITIKYNERNSLSIPDTSVSLEGNKVYIYKVDKNNLAKRTEVEIGIRNEGYLEVTSGLNEGERIVAEGLKKVRPNAKIKPIKK